MSSSVMATLKRENSNEHYICFTIEAGHSELDFICIEKKIPRKRKAKAIWSKYNQYKAMPVHQMLNHLSWMGFNLDEFRQA